MVGQLVVVVAVVEGEEEEENDEEVITMDNGRRSHWCKSSLHKHTRPCGKGIVSSSGSLETLVGEEI